MSKREPRKCPICGELFQPKTRQGRICGKKECRREFNRRKNEKKSQEMFLHGKVFILDMAKPESEWIWEIEERE